VDQVRIRPERVTLIAVVVVLLGSLPLGLSSPYLAWVMLLPIGAMVWVLRARVVADEQSVEVCNGLAVRRVAWPDVAGFTVPRRGPVRLLRHGHRPLLLTALNRGELPRLLAVSQPDDDVPATRS
jgi:hypothetical protein